MPQQTRDSECHCCLTVKYNYTSNLYLLFHWYCERGGDNEDALTLGRDLINLLFSQRCLQTFFIFLSRAVASLADVFEKNEKKNKTTSMYRLSFLWQAGFNRHFLKCRAFSPPWSCTGVLSQFVILFALCTSWRKVINRVALCNNNYPSNFVLNLAVAKEDRVKAFKHSH